MANDYSIHVGDTDIDLSYVTNSVSVYNITCDVIRDSKTNSSTGIAITPVTIVNLMPCHIKWRSGKEMMRFNKKTHYIDAVLNCRVPVGVTIVTTDRIYYNSEYYEIIDLYDMNNLGKLLVIGIKKIK